IPTTYYLKSNEQLESIINTEGFPIIIKPYNMFDNEFHRLFNNKVLKIFNDKEYNMYKEKIKSIFSKVIVQPMIQGENIAIYGYFKDDKFISWCGCKKDYMSSWGTTVIGHSMMNNDLYVYSKDILSKIGYEGFAELEFIYDTKNKRYVILEINSRPVQWCRLCSKVTKPIEIIPFEVINKCKFGQTYDIKENINIYYETGLIELYDTNKIEFKDIFKYIFNSQSISMFMDIKDMKPSIRYLLTFIKSLIKSIIK
ncbi:hypothetical protein, partial [Clostridium novyi]|uniref:ATP-binding protein n=1 Tax=Clostridium novyi TaxID=1542 RepID=UPI0012D2AA21